MDCKTGQALWHIFKHQKASWHQVIAKQADLRKVWQTALIRSLFIWNCAVTGLSAITCENGCLMRSHDSIREWM
jgi:hypothetical protein